VDYSDGDFTPTAVFLRIINKAHRFLDLRLSHEDRGVEFREAMSQGQYLLDTPEGLKYIVRIDIEDGDGKVLPEGGLQRVSIDWLRDKYGKVFSQVEAGTPRYWARERFDPSSGDDGIVVMPPAKDDCTVIIHSARYAVEMNDDSDVSWWSDKHPDILELAIKRQIAIDLSRNKTEQNDYEVDIEKAILDVETDVAMEKYAGPPVTRRFGWRP